MLNKLGNSESTDFDDGFAAGFIIGQKKQINTLGSDDWQLPESFQNMPEASEHQIIILYEATTINRPVLNICPMPYTYDGSEYIDWGDGTKVIIKPDETTYNRNYSHVYTAAGVYVITINCSTLTEYVFLNKEINSTFVTGGVYPPAGVDTSLNRLNALNNCIRAIKFGENIYSRTTIEAENDFTGLIYVKYFGNSYNNAAEKWGDNSLDRLRHYGCSALCRVDFDVFPEKISKNMFYGCVALRNAHFTKNLIEIPQSAFQNCTALSSVDISSAETVGAIAFKDCVSLVSVDMSSAVSVGSSAFQNCTSLCGLKYSEDCVFAGGSTENCLCLYPKP